MSKVHTVIVDFDGTLAPAVWPDFPTTLLPGAREAMKLLHAEGLKLTVFSARLNPYDPHLSIERPKHEVQQDLLNMRNLLDREGLRFMDIWTLPGKPSGTVYVDDRGLRFNGKWNKTAEKILLYCGKEEAVFPAFDMEAAAEAIHAPQDDSPEGHL